MACEDFREDLSAWVDDELTPTAYARVAAHLQTCSECSKLLQEFQATSLLVRELATPRAPDFVTDAAMRLVRAMPRQEAEPWTVHAWRFLCQSLFPKAGVAAVAFAAGVVLVVIVGRHEWGKNFSDNKVIASSEMSDSLSHSRMAEGASATSASRTATPPNDPYRLASAPSDAATGVYDFRDPKTHGSRDVDSFDEKERLAWQEGTWRHERRFGRDGWWWVVDRVWYGYEQSTDGPPIYVSAIRFVNPLALNNPDSEQSSAPKE
jgi:Putative zinc-finger